MASYANLIHLKPVVSTAPREGLLLQAGLGLQWRETTEDAVYAIPTQAVPNTAGHGHLWLAAYVQVDASQKITPNVTLSAQAVRYQVGATIRQAGGRNTNYAMLQLPLAW